MVEIEKVLATDVRNPFERDGNADHLPRRKLRQQTHT
jgi:hypothetical protein